MNGFRTPQHVQNLVIRDYCQNRQMKFLLSGTEYAISSSFIMLNQLIDRLDKLEGLVLYSLFQLPEDSDTRRKIYARILDTGKTMHFAVEALSLVDRRDVGRIEDIWSVFSVMRDLPDIKEQLEA
jgi:sporadic carbohydrate cluster protein (TIGR04323 family)